MTVRAPIVQKLGRYEILGELATGGMAEILLGRVVGPSGFERVVVIKRILPHLAREKAFVQMFLDEARTVARIRHPNVVQVHELGGDDDGSELYLVMEYLEGESVAGLLRRLAVRGDSLAPELAAHIVAEACRGLHAAHELTDGELPLDLVHRDISPQNIFITYDGAVKVLDFGIAKAADRGARTEAGQVKGKLAYMSPEQCAGKPLDRRSDVFALGTVLYELLTGRRLFKRATDLATLKAICEQSVASPSTVVESLPASLDAVCDRALARSRDQRFSSADEMRRELVSAMRGLSVVDDPEERLSRLMRELFADRIEEKREMLREARTSSAGMHVPSAETDEAVELPCVDGQDEIPTAADVPARSARPTTRRRWLAWSAVGVAATAALAAAISIATREKPRAATEAFARTSAGETSDASRHPVVSTSLALSASTSPAPAISGVALHVESNPPGAHVFVGGKDLGVAPLDTRLARSSSPSELVLRRPGFVPLTTTLVPDVDQRLVLTLQRAGRVKPPAVPRIEKLP